MVENLRFDLTWLLDPIPSSTFFSEYWEEKPLFVRRKDPTYYASLLSLDEIDPLITVRPPDTVTVTNSDAPLEVSEFARNDGTLDVVRACQLFADGTTILIQEGHKSLVKLAALCRELERAISAPFQCNLYMTPAHGKGFSTHYDTHDVFLLQVAGSKEWTIFDSPVRLPLNGQPFDENLHAIGQPTMSFVLQAGDFLYIPRGFLHHARSINEISLHVTLGALSYRWADVLLEVIAQHCLVDPAFRRSLPVGFARGNIDAAAARRTFAELFSRAAEGARPESILDRLAEEFVLSRRAFVPGQLSQLSLAKELALTDAVGARPATIYRMQMDGEMVRVIAHGREIRLHVDTTETLAFALEQKEYYVKDLPGDLGDEEKLVLVRRLIEEGLVWKLCGG